jgi:hypothetical protein
MSGRIHAGFLAVAALGAAVGAMLWTRWGTAIWIADLAAWCG